ncbi:MAG TPA: Uma2 family endonuclease [Coleofasciculaceae cyanobacterium]|jgi:hypothetical protein
MVVTQKSPSDRPSLTVTWEKLPDDFQLEDEPVENTDQPLLAGALREALELADYIRPGMLIASNFGLCATVNESLVIKAPDWVYVPSVFPQGDPQTRRSYTPNLEGDIPLVVMEFLSDTDGGEYSVRRFPPLGKLFYYEQILQIPIYVVFEPKSGHLEVFQLQAGRYDLLFPNSDRSEPDRYWIAEMNLFLGVWQGEKEGRSGYWLRWWDADQNLLLWGMERIEQERQRAEQERQRAERLAEYLRSQGINPDDLS